jgi:hypothetical protein
MYCLTINPLLVIQGYLNAKLTGMKLLLIRSMKEKSVREGEWRKNEPTLTFPPCGKY